MAADKTRPIDVVYFVKNSPQNDELRYSLRLLEKNLAFRKVWIYGGKPDDIEPDEFVKVNQNESTKWANVRKMYRLACLNDKITDDFVLMNDDFFIMKKLAEVSTFYRGTLAEHIIELESAYNDRPTDYSKLLRGAFKALRALDLPALSYELHVPFVFNRHRLLEVLGAFPNERVTRTLYANYFKMGGEQMGDVKDFGEKLSFDYRKSTFLSTQDTTAVDGHEVWDCIKNEAKEPSKFEREVK